MFVLGTAQFILTLGAYTVKSYIETRDSVVCPKPWESISGMLMVSNIFLPMAGMLAVTAPFVLLGIDLSGYAHGLAIFAIGAGVAISLITAMTGSLSGRMVANVRGYEYQ